MSEINFKKASTKGDYNIQKAADDFDYIILLFQRDFHCTNCRSQVQKVDDRYEEFLDVNTQVVSVLPENLSRAEDWDDEYNLSYPIVADEDKKISESFDQPVRFGPLGNLHDLIGRMPLTIIIDCTGDEIEVVHRYAGSNPSDRLSVDDILDKIEDLNLKS